MIFQARCVFILYYFNLFLTIKSQGPKGGSYSCKGKGKMKQGEFILINIATTSFIMDNVVKKYETYISKKNSWPLKQILMDMIEPELDPRAPERRNIMNLMYVAYIATEYMNSLMICSILSLTHEDVWKLKIYFIPIENDEIILNSCPGILPPFIEFMKTYSAVIKDYKNAFEDQHMDTIFTMKSMISECAETIYKTYEELMEQYYNARLFFDYFALAFLHGNNNREACLENIRPYFHSSVTATSKIYLPVTSIANSLAASNVYAISEDERFLWRNVVNIKNTYDTDMHLMRILFKCEELRNELAFYAAGEIHCIHPIDVQRNYSYTNFEILFNDSNEKYFYFDTRSK